MTRSLASQIGLGTHELVSIVGAGGKTTILRTLGHELARSGRRVILTTTTRMAPSQVSEPVCWSSAPRDVGAAMVPGNPLFVMSEVSPDKAVGLDPEAVNRLFSHTSVDHVLVEADGARTKSIKAPADHEPVIPAATTVVIVVMGADALGERLADVAHRPERVAELTDTTVNTMLTTELAASVLLHPAGGLKNIPPNARVIMAITKVPVDNEETVQQLLTQLSDSARVDRVVTVPMGTRQ